MFGINRLFYVLASGEHVQQILPFAYGSVRGEMTGPAFIGDTLILSVQHPGEDMSTTEAAPATLAQSSELAADTRRPEGVRAAASRALRQPVAAPHQRHEPPCRSRHPAAQRGQGLTCL